MSEGQVHAAQPRKFQHLLAPDVASFAADIHLVFAVSTLVLWAWVVWEAWTRFPVPPAPNAHGPRHRLWARVAAIDLLLTAVTGSAFYWLAFVAG